MSMFTRRHYIWLASVARDIATTNMQITNHPIAKAATDAAIGELAQALQDESPGFNRDEFLQNVYDDPTKKVAQLGDFDRIKNLP